jgi:HSP20 family protein
MLVDETPQGTFSRQLFLGENLDSDRLEASFDRGVLTITLPVSERAKPRRVQITDQSGGSQPVAATSGSSGGTSSGG